MRQWTTKDMQYLKSHALLAETNEVLNISEMAKRLKRSPAAVSKKICDIRRDGDLPQVDRSKAFDSKGRPWNTDEDKKLIAMKKGGASHKEIAEALDRPVSSINNRSNRLSRKKKINPVRVFWTEDEIQKLVTNIAFDENGFVSNYSELSRIVGKRYEQVQTKVARLRKDGRISVQPKEGATSLKSKEAMNRFNNARFAHVPKQQEEDKTVTNVENANTQDISQSISIESREVTLILTTTIINDQKVQQFFTKEGELLATKKPTSVAPEVRQKMEYI